MVGGKNLPHLQGGVLHCSATVFHHHSLPCEALQVWQRGRKNDPAVAAEMGSQKRYQALWRKQLREHVTGQAIWPPHSRYASSK